MEYSAVSHPPVTPCSFIQRGTPSSMEAAQRTWVRPKETRTEPEACGAIPGWNEISRRASEALSWERLRVVMVRKGSLPERKGQEVFSGRLRVYRLPTLRRVIANRLMCSQRGNDPPFDHITHPLVSGGPVSRGRLRGYGGRLVKFPHLRQSGT